MNSSGAWEILSSNFEVIIVITEHIVVRKNDKRQHKSQLNAGKKDVQP